MNHDSLIENQERLDEDQMKTSVKIFNCIKEKGYSYGELSRITGIPKAMLQRYATGVTEKVPLSRLRVLAKALDVPEAYFLGATIEQPATAQEPPLSEKEQELIEAYRKARPTFQKEALDMLKRHPEKR